MSALPSQGDLTTVVSQHRFHWSIDYCSYRRQTQPSLSICSVHKGAIYHVFPAVPGDLPTGLDKCDVIKIYGTCEHAVHKRCLTCSLDTAASIWYRLLIPHDDVHMLSVMLIKAPEHARSIQSHAIKSSVTQSFTIVAFEGTCQNCRLLTKKERKKWFN